MHQHLQLIDRARKLGIKVQDVSPLMQQAAAILEHGGISELIKEGVPTSWINVRSQFYCDNKQLTKLAYKGVNVPYPKSITFQKPDGPELEAFFEKGQVYVCKPLDATNGIGVVMDIRDIEMVKTYYEEHKYLETLFMLEEQIQGEDLRIHVIGGKIVAACIRKPALVTGNGKDTLQTLIDERRALMKTQNPLNFLEIDASSESLLKQQKIGLGEVPFKGRNIQLKKVSNMAQGGIAIDVTDDIHPIFHEWVGALSQYLETGYFGLDLITTDYTEHPEGHSWVLEINARADWLHHTFSERKTHDMAGIILQALFG